MENVILVIHLILALSIIGLVLLQRSEGGGLGIGGGGGGLTTAKGAANALTRATAICAALFFCTSLGLGILAGKQVESSVLEDALTQDSPAAVEAVQEVQDSVMPSDETLSTEAPVAPVAE